MKSLFILISLFFFSVFPFVSHAAIIDDVAGYIVLQTDEHGEAWYIDPSNHKRYFLGNPENAFSIMRQRGKGISNADLKKIPKAGNNWDGKEKIMNRVRGKILLQVKKNGEAWYVHPKDGKRYFLGTPDDAFNLINTVGIGIHNDELASIPAAKHQPKIIDSARYSERKIRIHAGTFDVNLVKMNRKKIRMVTATTNTTDCTTNCPVQSVADFVQKAHGIAGINGGYFCPSSYGGCVNQINSFLAPVFNYETGTMINSYKLPFHSGPMIVVTTDNTYYYFHRTIDFGYSVEEFEQRNQKTVAAAIANYPALVENGRVVINQEIVSPSQQSLRLRVGIGYNNKSLFIVAVKNASVKNLAAVFRKLHVDYALNLDGGTSTGLFVDGEYKIGPGRDVPNAVIFQ